MVLIFVQFVHSSKKIGQVQFSWVHWMKFINARGAVCSYYHASTREKLYPNSRFGGPDPFLSQWDNTPVRQIIKREHGKYLRKVSVTPGRVKIRRGSKVVQS